AVQAREVYRIYIRRFFPALAAAEDAGDVNARRRINEMVDEKIQIAIKHDGVGLDMDGRLRDKGGFGLRDLLRELKADPTIDLRAYNRGGTVHNVIAHLKGAKMAAELSEEEIEKYLRFLADNNIELYWWEKNFSDVHTGAKYAQWANMFPHMRGEITFALDWDHEHTWEDLSMLPMVGMDFDADPKLAVAPYRSYIFTKSLSNTAKAMGTAEEGWVSHEQRVKQEVGALGMYGKAFFRTQFARDMDALQDEYVAEDIETALRFMTFGMNSKHIDYLSTGKALPNDYVGALSPLRKWSGDAPESLMGATPLKFLLSPRTHWTKKWDTVVSFGFYLKKPRVVRYVLLLTILHFTLPWNPLTGLTIVFYIGAVVLGQAISYGAIFNRWDESGVLKGTFLFLFYDLPLTLMPFFMGILVHYGDAVQRGFRKFAKFIPTMGKGGATKRQSFRDVYTSNTAGIMLGASLTLLILLSPIDPGRVVIWFFIIMTVTYGWFMSPFIFNPEKAFGRGMNRLMLWTLLGWLSAVVITLFVPIPYFKLALPALALLVTAARIIIANPSEAAATAAWSARHPLQATGRFFNQLSETNLVHIALGFVLGLVDFLYFVILFPFGLLDEAFGGRRFNSPILTFFTTSFMRRWVATYLWLHLRAYQETGLLPGPIDGDIGNLALRHFAGLKAYTVGRLRGNPPITYLFFMWRVLWAARRSLRSRGVDWRDVEPQLVEARSMIERKYASTPTTNAFKDLKTHLPAAGAAVVRGAANPLVAAVNNVLALARADAAPKPDKRFIVPVVEHQPN
ncbi:MAG: hypothetical protein JO102_01765, partial [Elusimicrobia bacterium]|nr:hypothetical protein [Elusimicrobiota bacterium]